MKRATQSAKTPPGPRGSFLTGNLQAYEQDRLGFLMRARRDYGPIASFDARTTVIFDPVLADRVLRDPTGSFQVSQNFLGQTLTVEQITSIMEVRQLLNPGLRPSALRDVPHHVAELVYRNLDLASVHQTIDPQCFAERVIPEAFSWRLFGAGEAPFLPQVADLLDLLEKVIGNVFAAPAAWRSPAQRRIESRHSDLRVLVSRHLAVQSRTRGAPGKGLMTDLAGDVVERGQATPPKVVADLLIGAMLAAQCVPAAGAGWVLMMLADHPELQTDLQREADDFVHRVSVNAPVSSAQFPLALATVFETLRLYPPTWLITRVATRDTTLAGYRFRSGHMFMISPYVLHRDPELFDQPEVFSPQRWLASAPPPMTFLSFGRGQHKCPGSDLTTTSLVALVLSVLSRFEIRRSGVIRPDPRNTLKPSGLRIHLDARKGSNAATVQASTIRLA